MNKNNQVNLTGTFPPSESLDENGRPVGVVAGDSRRHDVGAAVTVSKTLNSDTPEFIPDGL